MTTAHSLSYRVAGYLFRDKKGKVRKQGNRGFDVGMEESDVKDLL